MRPSFREGEAMEDFALRLQSLVSQLAVLGVTIDEEDVVAKYLRVVPTKYVQIALTRDADGPVQAHHRGRDRAPQGGR
jgi:Na+-transporting NADH:ubiquinone oxidoreductase subunit NqrA